MKKIIREVREMTFRVMVVNRSKELNQGDLAFTVKAINNQLRLHFGPAWHIDCMCFLQYKRKEPNDAIIYIDDEPTTPGAGGFHDVEPKTSKPVGYAFLSVSTALQEAYSITLSHEMMELILNRHCNYFAIGKHPKDARKKAALWLEACDAVQDQSYKLDGVEVSDFVLPLYFTPIEERNGQNNFMKDKPVKSFGVTSGGYIGYYDFDLKQDQTWFPEDDERARKRQYIKGSIGAQRRKERVSLLFSETE